MRTVTKTVYTYSELSDDAKAEAREWYRDITARYFSPDDLEHVIEMVDTAAKLIGIEISRKRQGRGLSIYWSVGGGQGDGASFEGTWHAGQCKPDALKAEFPEDTELHRLADALAEIAAEYPDATASAGHGRSFNLANLESDSGIDPYADAPSREAHEAFPSDDAEECLRDFAHWVYRALEREFESLSSDEVIAEIIEANGYEFTAEGEQL